jgi:hypothetical protein
MRLEVGTAEIEMTVSRPVWLLIETPAWEFWFGREYRDHGLPGMEPGTREDLPGGSVSVRYFAGCFLVITRKPPQEAREPHEPLIEMVDPAI